MWTICKKEWNQFFSNLTGYIAIFIFLLFIGLTLFVFPDTSLLNYGYASLDGFFKLAPWTMILFIPTITMRSLADEYKSGSFELLQTLPLTPAQIAYGKFWGALFIVYAALLPTLIYAVSIERLSVTGGLDVGAVAGSYIGLLLLGALFTAIGVCASSFTNNTVVAFIAGAFMCFLLYSGFTALAKLSLFQAGADYYIELLGIQFHYLSISRGVIEIGDLIYFTSMIIFFLLITKKNITRK